MKHEQLCVRHGFRSCTSARAGWTTMKPTNILTTCQLFCYALSTGIAERLRPGWACGPCSAKHRPHKHANTNPTPLLPLQVHLFTPTQPHTP
eukprot:1157876-Pelagomonas_calceolata.AAC.6